MNTDYSIFEVILAVIAGFFFGIITGVYLQDRVHSKQPIQPELTIKVSAQGVADTTWTYIELTSN
jgi:hypothetical protein